MRNLRFRGDNSQQTLAEKVGVTLQLQSYDLTKVDNFRVYNVAFAAANATEQKIIADNVFSVAPMKIVIFSMNPILTFRHGNLTNSMLPREKWRALFSTQSLTTQAVALIYKENIA